MDDIQFAKNFITMLNKSDLNYCITDVDEDKKAIDMLVLLSDYSKFKEFMSNSGARYKGSSTEQFEFIYRLEPDQYWYFDDSCLIHAGCQLSCTSLSNLSKCKLPLDKKIQQSIWSTRFFCDGGYWRLSVEDYFISLLTKCVFDEKGFSERDIHKILMCDISYESLTLKDKLQGVFFNFADEILELIREERFDNIICAYRMFADY